MLHGDLGELLEMKTGHIAGKGQYTVTATTLELPDGMIWTFAQNSLGGISQQVVARFSVWWTAHHYVHGFLRRIRPTAQAPPNSSIDQARSYKRACEYSSATFVCPHTM